MQLGLIVHKAFREKQWKKTGTEKYKNKTRRNKTRIIKKTNLKQISLTIEEELAYTAVTSVQAWTPSSMKASSTLSYRFYKRKTNIKSNLEERRKT